MSWITVIWSASMGACLVLALMHLLIWCRDCRSLANLVFPVIALGIIAMGACELDLMRTSSPERYAATVRIGHLAYGITVAASLVFVHHTFGTGRTWLLLTALGLRAAAVAANYTTGSSLHFLSIEELDSALFLGEPVSVVKEAVENPWVRLGQFAAIVQIGYVADASLRLWRKGGQVNRLRAFWIGGSILLLFLLAMVIAGLISAGVLRAPMLVSFPFFGMVIAISYDMSRDLQRTALLVKELESSERRLALAGSAGRLAFWEWDLKKDRIWISPDGWTVFGIAPTAELGFGKFMEHVHEDDRARLERIVREAIGGSATHGAEFRVRPSGGHARWLSASGRVEKNEAGEPVLFRGISLEVTARKEAEAEAARQRLELAHLARASTLGALSATLAHELNQPLAAILSNAQVGSRRLASEPPDLSEMEEILSDIVADTKRAGGIIHGMRAMFKKEEPVEPQLVDLNELVMEVLHLLNGEIVSRKIRVEFSAAESLPRALASRIEILQVLVNLVLNSLDALKEYDCGGTGAVRHIRIETLAGNTGPAVRVSDNGPGIPEEFIPRLFESFASSKKDGLGLGLSISRRIAERFGGTLELETGNGAEGAAFLLTLTPAKGKTEACQNEPIDARLQGTV